MTFVPMICYVVGLVLCGLAYYASYLTQLRLYNESRGETCGQPHTRPLGVAKALALLSLAGCSRENVVERLTRECEEIVAASIEPGWSPEWRAHKIRDCIWKRGTKESGR